MERLVEQHRRGFGSVSNPCDRGVELGLGRIGEVGKYRDTGAVGSLFQEESDIGGGYQCRAVRRAG